jgi:hypothetical protein
MTPYELAKQIVEEHVPESSRVRRSSLIEAIRRAILLGQIEARKPLDVTPQMVPAIVYQFVDFVNDYRERLQYEEYPAAANALQDCIREVLALHGVEPAISRKPVAGEARPARKRATA